MYSVHCATTPAAAATLPNAVMRSAEAPTSGRTLAPALPAALVTPMLAPTSTGTTSTSSLPAMTTDFLHVVATSPLITGHSNPASGGRNLTAKETGDSPYSV